MSFLNLTPPENGLPAGFKSVFVSVRALITRVFMHLVFILGSIVISMLQPGGFTFITGLTSYISLVHIFPRKPHPPATGAGLALAAALALTGVPVAALPVWAAGCTWLIRMITRQGVSPASWISLPILAAMAVNMVAKPGHGDWTSLGLFVLFSAAGLLASGLFKRYFLLRRYRLEAQTALITLRRLAFDAQNIKMKQALTRLGDLVELYIPAALPGYFRRPEPDDASLVEQLAVLPVFVEQNGGTDCAAAIEQLADRVQKRITVRGRGQTALPKEASAVERHLAAVRALEERLPTLPEAVKPQAGLICEQARMIIEAMKKDPQDRPAADRFLSRYLPAIDTVLTGYIKLSVSPPSENSARTMNRAVNTMSELAEAFKEHRQELLANDAMDITIDLGVIEKLLKMDGRSFPK